MTAYLAEALRSIRDGAAGYAALSDEIWGYAETAYRETRSAAALCGALEAHGFTVTRGVGGIETAFTGRFGEGKPVIGFLGEYDALYGLSQRAGTAKAAPGPVAESGHGCGHNLLGVGSLAAAVAAADYLKRSGQPGTVIYFGCPGEEGGSGKAFMAKAGVFDGLDAALTWHPGEANAVMSTGTLSNIQARYIFSGKSAHAAGAPHLGRSALDAVELMNVGANYLREHIVSDARLHYAVTDTGGKSPNVVQAHAESIYLIRAPRIDDAREIFERVNDVARGAALMTGTKVEIDFMKACSDFVQNETVQRVMAEAMQETGLPAYTDAERAAAKAFGDTLPGGAEAAARQGMMQFAMLVGRDGAAKLAPKLGTPIREFLLEYRPTELNMPASTDVGDVSHLCPTAQIGTATCAAGTPPHAWQMVAQGTLPLAHRGMLQAAEILARTAVRLLTDPALLEAAKAEFRERTGSAPFVSPIPDGVRPRPMAE